jgi:hypothetical protein
MGDAGREVRGDVPAAHGVSGTSAQQAQGCAPPPQVAEPRAKTTHFLPEARWAGQDARIQRII